MTLTNKKINDDDSRKSTYGDIVEYAYDGEILKCKITTRANYIEDVLFKKSVGDSTFFIEDDFTVHSVEILSIKEGK